MVYWKQIPPGGICLDPFRPKRGEIFGANSRSDSLCLSTSTNALIVKRNLRSSCVVFRPIRMWSARNVGAIRLRKSSPCLVAGVPVRRVRLVPRLVHPSPEVPDERRSAFITHILQRSTVYGNIRSEPGKAFPSLYPCCLVCNHALYPASFWGFYLTERSLPCGGST